MTPGPIVDPAPAADPKADARGVRLVLGSVAPMRKGRRFFETRATLRNLGGGVCQLRHEVRSTAEPEWKVDTDVSTEAPRTAIVRVTPAAVGDVLVLAISDAGTLQVDFRPCAAAMVDGAAVASRTCAARGECDPLGAYARACVDDLAEVIEAFCAAAGAEETPRYQPGDPEDPRWLEEYEDQERKAVFTRAQVTRSAEGIREIGHAVDVVRAGETCTLTRSVETLVRPAEGEPCTTHTVQELETATVPAQSPQLVSQVFDMVLKMAVEGDAASDLGDDHDDDGSMEAAMHVDDACIWAATIPRVRDNVVGGLVGAFIGDDLIAGLRFLCHA
jgi:hypothetical protein